MARDRYNRDSASSGQQDMTSKPSPTSVADDTLLEELLSCLEGIEAKGDFASFGALEHIVDPGIHIKASDGIDHAIKIPLNEQGARALSGASHHAPFGKGSETIVDTSIRRTWELNADQFELRNPEWQQYLDGIIAKVSKDLGVSSGTGGLRAELYKMLLYEKGAMFKAHTNTEKVPGMFGTLVVCLPSRHKGGSVILKQRGEAKVFSSASAAQSYICWYSDVSHEVTEITSGYRWVLTYNLVRANPPSTANGPSIESIEWQDVTDLKTIFNRWRKDLSKGFPHERLMYILDHQYTEANLKAYTLKGRDAVIGQYLEAACADTGFRFYLANLEQMVSGGAAEDDYCYSTRYGYHYGRYDSPPPRLAGRFHEIEDECDREVKLKYLVDPEGDKIGEDIEVDEEDILQSDPFARDPDDEDYEGFTGNEGASATHWYRETVIVIMPRDYVARFLLTPFEADSSYTYYGFNKTPPLKLEGVMDRFMQRFSSNPGSEERKYNLLQACEFVINYNTAKLEGTNNGIAKIKSASWHPRKLDRFPDTVIEKVVKASSLLQRPDLFVRAVFCVKDELPAKLFSEIGSLVRTYGFDSLREGLDRAIAGTVSIHKRVAAVQNIIAGAADSSKDEQCEDQVTLSDWGLWKIEGLIKGCAKVCSKDGMALIDVAAWQWQQQRTREFLHGILPFVKQHVRNTPFIINFLVAMSEAAEKDLISKEAASTAFEDVFRALIPVFTLCNEPESDEEHGSVSLDTTLGTVGYPRRSTTAPTVRKAPIPGEALAKLLDECIRRGLDAELSKLLNTVRLEAASIDPRDFRTMLLPFLREAVAVLERHKISFTEEPLYRDLYRELLKSFVKRYVGSEPPPQSSWARRPVQCGCTDCQWLNIFLISPTEEIGYFPMAKRRRQHLHNQLNGRDCTHETRRNTNPTTLVVTKTKSAWQREHQNWQKRAQAATQDMASLKTEYLKALLGDAYEDITQLKIVRYIAPPSLRPLLPPPGPPAAVVPLAPTMGNQRTKPPLSQISKRISQACAPKRKSSEVDGSKRKKPAPDVIDLTGEGSGEN